MAANFSLADLLPSEEEPFSYFLLIKVFFFPVDLYTL